MIIDIVLRRFVIDFCELPFIRRFICYQKSSLSSVLSVPAEMIPTFHGMLSSFIGRENGNISHTISHSLNNNNISSSTSSPSYGQEINKNTSISNTTRYYIDLLYTYIYI